MKIPHISIVTPCCRAAVCNQEQQGFPEAIPELYRAMTAGGDFEQAGRTGREHNRPAGMALRGDCWLFNFRSDRSLDLRTLVDQVKCRSLHIVRQTIGPLDAVSCSAASGAFQ